MSEYLLWGRPGDWERTLTTLTAAERKIDAAFAALEAGALAGIQPSNIALWYGYFPRIHDYPIGVQDLDWGR